MSLRQLTMIIALAPVGAVAQAPAINPATVARIDSLFSKYNKAASPGCALGVSRHDTLVLERAWGSAQLEFGVPNTPSTKFEAGSVSKQFTAAAILRLAQQGKLSLDDDIRKYLPEMPKYDQVITVRHLIHHISGLRDWGVVMNFAGWPRGTRTYTQAHVLDILSRQHSLNFPVGAEYLYSNSNYNLLAMIAERVSGKSLPEFTRTEFFEPLGMTNTSWRDDYSRVVPGRAQAYSQTGGGWRLDMPFENVYGNSSLITTVGDLLKWNANLGSMRVGGRDFVAAQLRHGKLTNGRQIPYAAGLFVIDQPGKREIWHDGATAGYRAFLIRYPDAGYAIALLCNAGDVNPGQLGRQVATMVDPSLAPSPPSADTIGVTLPAARLAALSGNFRSSMSDELLAFAVDGPRFRIAGGPILTAVNDREFKTFSGRTHFLFDGPAAGPVTRVRLWTDDGDTTDYVPAGTAKPANLREYEGRYSSNEAEVEFVLRVERDTLVLTGRPATRITMRPIYRDGFAALGSTVRFTRGNTGRVDGFLATSGRARRIRFERISGRP